jgi:NAD(P)-dependent dehydrogenase (short-subunit alcohol dehydrogenase family)
MATQGRGHATQQSWFRNRAGLTEDEAPMAGGLQGRVAIVTGGGSGIGQAACAALAAQGAHIVAVSRRQEALEETIALTGGPGRPGARRSVALALDVRSAADMEAMAARTLEWFGRIDLLVCAAGVLRRDGSLMNPVAAVPVADWDDVIATNLRGVFLANRAVLPAMLRQGEGDIFNVSSTTGSFSVPFDAAYSASKCGVNALTSALAEEVWDAGVRVQLLVPGPFQTPLLDRRWTGAHVAQEFPPASRVADVIAYLAMLPRDTRLLSLVVKPTLVPERRTWVGSRGGAKAAAPAAERIEGEPGAGLGTDLPTEVAPPVALRGKVLIVTEAGSAIGQATCRALAGEGAAVIAADPDPGALQAAVSGLALSASGERGHLALPLDAAVEASHQALAKAALDRHGRIDGLIACPRAMGIGRKPVEALTIGEWDEVQSATLRASFLSCRAVLPAMMQRREGTIVNVMPPWTWVGGAGRAARWAASAGIIGLSQSLADEVRSHGIRVQVVQAGTGEPPLPDRNGSPRPWPAPERVADCLVYLLTRPLDSFLVNPGIAHLGGRPARGRRSLQGSQSIEK